MRPASLTLPPAGPARTGVSPAGLPGPFLARDPEFRAVAGEAPRLVRVAETDAHEGPVYAADEDALYFTTTREAGGAVRRLELATGRVTTVRDAGTAANGMTLDGEGRLVVCEQGSPAVPGRIVRLDRGSGEAEVLADGLASPNDVVCRRDGTIWFTDPAYGFLQGFRPAPERADVVYRLDPERGSLDVVADSLDKPNGLAFSPDEFVLYAGDSGAIHAPGDYDPSRPRRVLAFDVAGAGLANERVACDRIPGFPDGLAVDAEGRLFVSAATGVCVFAPDGRPLGEISLPGAVNFTFGGAGLNVLYITADTAVWAGVLATKGA